MKYSTAHVESPSFQLWNGKMTGKSIRWRTDLKQKLKFLGWVDVMSFILIHQPLLPLEEGLQDSKNVNVWMFWGVKIKSLATGLCRKTIKWCSGFTCTLQKSDMIINCRQQNQFKLDKIVVSKAEETELIPYPHSLFTIDAEQPLSSRCQPC